MKTRIWILATLIAMGWYQPAASFAAEEATEMTDEQAVQAMRDLGLPPETVLDMVKQELRESLQNRTNAATDQVIPPAAAANGTAQQAPVGAATTSNGVGTDSSTPATDDDTEMTDEQASKVLQDLGLPPTAILTMIRKQLMQSLQKETGAAAAVESPKAAEPAAATAQTAAGAVTDQPVTVTAAMPPTVVTQPDVRTIDDFRSSLSPYGTWVRVDPYGLVWQPTVTMINTTWRPYYNDGSWEWTDDGWSWRSRYSWGWAPFHYGRWTYVTGHRWIWIPDTVWAPSWVQWRYSDAYVGWAPLPPEAYYNHSLGFSYRGSRVSVDCDFGLTDWHFSFVPSSGFMHRHPSHYGIPRQDTRRIYNDTVNVRRTYTTRNNVTLPALPRDIASNAGRRTDNIRRVTIQNPAGSAAAGTTVHAPLVTPARITVTSPPKSSVGRVESDESVHIFRQNGSANVVNTPAQAPAAGINPVTRAKENAERRTSELLDLLRRKAQNNAQGAGFSQGALNLQTQPDVRKVTPPSSITAARSGAVHADAVPVTRNPRTIVPAQVSVTPRSAIVTTPDVRTQSGADSRTGDAVSSGKSTDTNARDSDGSTRSGSRGNRLQSLIKDRQN